MKQVIALSAAAVAVSALGHGASLAADATDDFTKAVRGTIPPDRLSVDKASPHYDECYRRMGVRFDGAERSGDVQEYCVSEGWILVRARDGKGRFKKDGDSYVFETLHGEVEPYFRHGIAPAAPDRRQTPEQAAERIAAAEAKRARKAEKLKKQMGGA